MQEQAVPFYDHHAHSIRRDHLTLDVHAFRSCWTESRSQEVIDKLVPQQLHYIDMLRRLGDFLGVRGEEAIIAKRSKMNEREYVRSLFDAASIEALVVDDGFSTYSMMPIPQFQELCDRPVLECRRIESVLEQCITNSETFEDLSKEFAWRLIAETPARPVALKTIAAYRGGLTLDLVTIEQASADFAATKEQFHAGNTRISRRPLYHYFLMQAFEMAACHSLPVQVHTGLGDDDQNIVEANPLLMQQTIKLPTLQHTRWMLLHCFPYVREAALLCSLYPNVYMDLSLSMNLVSPLADSMLVDAYSCAPYSRILPATDGHSIPETYWYAATIWNEALERLQLPPAPPILFDTSAETAPAEFI